MYWIKDRRSVPEIRLDGNILPWVDRVKHLGNTISNEKFPTAADTEIKRARFIQRTCEINQDLYFAAPQTKLLVNDIYNSSWYGSNIWDLFSSHSVRAESSYNRSVKVALGLPYNTHRSLIEQLSGRPHVRITLCKRFLCHIEAMKESKKIILHTLVRMTENNAQSTTGRNLRYISLTINK